MNPDQPLPISLLTGFLGSGKTTVLRHILRHPDMTRTAVVINEFGEIGLDHHLIGSTIDDQTVLLDSGCLCCTVKDDLVRTLRQLYVRRAASEIPLFDRLVVETTGLADPASIIHSLLTDQLLADCYRLDGVVTTVDAATGDTTLGTYEEAVKQVALADRLLVTKTDITSSEAGERLRTKLRSLNRGAPIISVVEGVVSPTELFNAGYYNPETKRVDVRRWLAVEAYHHDEHGHDHHDEDQDHRYHDHLSNIYSFCLTFGTPVPWQPFVTAVRGLINSHGAKLLRIKGIINIANRSQPIVIHGVQQLLHPPVMLDAWPDDDHQSRIVFITRDIRRQTVEQALTAFI